MRGGRKKRLAKFYPRSFNMGLRKELAEKIGDFSKLRHGQDIEFSHRIIKSGAKTVFIPDAVVYHKRRTSLTKFFRQVFNWGVARINLYKIDSGMLEPLHFAPAVGLLTGLLFTIFAFCCSPIFSIWKHVVIIFFLLLCISGIHAGIKWKSIYTGLLIPIVTFLQITGYGMGFTFAFIRRVILGKEEFTGFVRRYY
jgi:GT2 family glycosyltransferase